MGKTDTEAVNQLASALKGQPRLHLTDSAATDATESVKTLSDNYSGNNLSVDTGTPPGDPFFSAADVASDLKMDGEMAVEKFKAMVTVLEATGSAIDGMAKTLKIIGNSYPPA